MQTNTCMYLSQDSQLVWMVWFSEGAWSNLFFSIASQRCWKLWLFIPTGLGQTGLISVLVWWCQAMGVTLLSPLRSQLQHDSWMTVVSWPWSFSQVTPKVGRRGSKALTDLEWTGMEPWVSRSWEKVHYEVSTSQGGWSFSLRKIEILDVLN